MAACGFFQNLSEPQTENSIIMMAINQYHKSLQSLHGAHNTFPIISLALPSVIVSFFIEIFIGLVSATKWPKYVETHHSQGYCRWSGTSCGGRSAGQLCRQVEAIQELTTITRYQAQGKAPFSPLVQCLVSSPSTVSSLTAELPWFLVVCCLRHSFSMIKALSYPHT